MVRPVIKTNHSAPSRIDTHTDDSWRLIIKLVREYKTRVLIWILFGQIETKYTQWKDNTSKASDNYLSFRDYAIFSRRLKFTSSFHNAVSSSLWNFDYIVFENVKGMTTIDQICKAFGLWARASYTWPWLGLSITFPILVHHHGTTGLEDGLILCDKRHPRQIIHDMGDVIPRKSFGDRYLKLSNVEQLNWTKYDRCRKMNLWQDWKLFNTKHRESRRWQTLATGKRTRN